jgi:hypothetical protein
MKLMRLPCCLCIRMYLSGSDHLCLYPPPLIFEAYAACDITLLSVYVSPHNFC